MKQLSRLLLFMFLISCIIESPCHASSLSKEERAAQLPYRLEVDLTHNLVIAYSPYDNSVKRTMLCSPGVSKGMTPTGTFYLPSKRKSEERGSWYEMLDCYVRYATRIEGPILFHSITYNKKSVKSIDKESWRKLGSPASHGCVRLAPLDAQWIAFNCAAGTKVVIHRVEKSEERKKMRDEIKATMSPAAEDGTVGDWESITSPNADFVQGLGTQSAEYVRALQKRLKDIGYYAGNIGGEYGEETVLAVMNFQEAMGYEPTGTSDEMLLEILYDSDVAIGPYVTIERGTSSSVVSALQKKLASQNYYTGEINGTYEKEMKDAIDQFCIDNGISPESGTDISPLIQESILSSGDPEPKRTPKPVYTASADDSGNDDARGGLSAGDYARVVLDQDGSTLNLRQTESSESGILSKIPHLAFVEILEIGEKYHKVEYEGIEGYASAKYIMSAS